MSISFFNYINYEELNTLANDYMFNEVLKHYSISNNEVLLWWEPVIWNTTSSNLYIEYNILTITNLICLGFLIFIIGFFGLLFNKGSLIFCLISIELIFLGLNFILIFLGYLINFATCQVLVLVLITLAAAETALGLSLILLYHNVYSNTSLRLLKNFNI